MDLAATCNADEIKNDYEIIKNRYSIQLINRNTEIYLSFDTGNRENLDFIGWSNLFLIKKYYLL